MPILNPLYVEKNLLYPINIPVQILFTNCKHYRSEIIIQKPDANWEQGFIYMFTETEGRNRGKSRPLYIGTFIELLVNGRYWDCYERQSLTPRGK